MDLGGDAVGGLLPLGGAGIVSGEGGLPEGDMAHSADAVHQHQLDALGLQSGDLLGVGGQVGLGGEVALIDGDGQLAQRLKESLLHGVLEGAGVGGLQGVALGVGPLVHVEGVHVLAGDLPLVQEVGDPAVHAHGANGQDESDLFLALLGQLDLHGDLMTHIGLEVAQRVTAHGLEVLVPVGLTVQDGLRRADAGVDLVEVPAGGVEAFQRGALDGVVKIHDVFSLQNFIFFPQIRYCERVNMVSRSSAVP